MRFECVVVCLTACLLVGPVVCPSVLLSVSVCPSASQPAFVRTWLCTCPPACLSVDLSFLLAVRPSVRMFVTLSCVSLRKQATLVFPGKLFVLLLTNKRNETTKLKILQRYTMN